MEASVGKGVAEAPMEEGVFHSHRNKGPVLPSGGDGSQTFSGMEQTDALNFRSGLDLGMEIEPGDSRPAETEHLVFDEKKP